MAENQWRALFECETKKRGLPYISSDPEIGKYLADMCVPFGTKITPNANGTLSCTW